VKKKLPAEAQAEAQAEAEACPACRAIHHTFVKRLLRR